jgi:hypothetical protein
MQQRTIDGRAYDLDALSLTEAQKRLAQRVQAARAELRDVTRVAALEFAASDDVSGHDRVHECAGRLAALELMAKTLGDLALRARYDQIRGDRAG